MASGGTLAKVKIGNSGEFDRSTRTPHKREKIKGFSRHARHRFLDEINSLDDSKILAYRAVFVTLTYHSDYPDPRASKKDLEKFRRGAERVFDAFGWWKLEPQQRGAPHYHLVLFIQPSQAQAFKDWVPGYWHEIAGKGSQMHLRFHRGELDNKHCVQIVPVTDRRCILSYLAKYIGKPCDAIPGWEYPGKFWGYLQQQKVTQLQTLLVTETSREAAIKVRRYLWRWIGSQPSNRCRIHLDGKVFNVQVGSPAWKLAKKLGQKIEPIMRKAFKGNGGCKVYMRDTEFARLLAFVGIALPTGKG